MTNALPEYTKIEGEFESLADMVAAVRQARNVVIIPRMNRHSFTPAYELTEAGEAYLNRREAQRMPTKRAA